MIRKTALALAAALSLAGAAQAGPQVLTGSFDAAPAVVVLTGNFSFDDAEVAAGGGAGDFTMTLLGDEGEILPGSCQFAATFDDSGAVVDSCRGATMMGFFAPPATAEPVFGPSLDARFGGARVFAEGNYLDSLGAAMDYSGDFTIQFWGKFDDPQPSFDTIAREVPSLRSREIAA